MQQWRYLIYDERAGAFLDAVSGQHIPAEGAFPDGTVVLWDGAAATAFPVWLAPTDGLPPGLPETWCVPVARARTVGELQRALAPPHPNPG